MKYELEFQRTQFVDTSGATVGISRQRWVSANPDDTITDIRERMEDNRFDVLPVHRKEHPVTTYYATEKWGNYEDINEKKIDADDILKTSSPSSLTSVERTETLMSSVDDTKSSDSSASSTSTAAPSKSYCSNSSRKSSEPLIRPCLIEP